MTSRPSRFPAVAKRRQPARTDSRLTAVFIGSLLVAALFFQPPAHSATTEKAAVARPSESAAKVAELEKGFWICDYLSTKQGVDMQQAATCSEIYEELKQTKFGGDFDKLVDWWRVNKIAQHKALESAGSAQF